MTRTLEAIFDGDVLRPEDKTGLEINTRYRITVERAETSKATAESEYPLTALLALAEDMGTQELAGQHDKLAHGKLN